MRNSIFFLFILVLQAFFWQSCEYPLYQDNNLDIAPPGPPPEVEISFNGGIDTLRLSGEVTLNYELNMQLPEKFRGEFRLQGKEWNIFNNSGSIYLSASQFNNGYDSLVLKLYFTTHTGSIAEQFGVEQQIVSRKWIVVIDDSPAPVINLQASTTSEGYLRLNWEKCNHLNFASYTLNISRGNNNVRRVIISDAGITQFIDSLYIGGDFKYLMECKLAGNGDNSYGNSFEINEPMPEMTFSEPHPDSVMISWNKLRPQARFRIQSDANNQTLEVDNFQGQSIIVEAPGFGSYKRYQITAYPGFQLTYSEQYKLVESNNYSLGENILPNWPKYAYNRVENMVYSNRYDNVMAYNANNQAVENQKHLYQLNYGGTSACQRNSSALAITTMDSIAVYSNKQLLNPTMIFHDAASYLDHLCFTNQGIIALSYNGYYSQIRISDKKELISIPVDDYPVYSKWACIATSVNGDYVNIVTNLGGKIYHISGETYEQTYSDSRNYRSAIFDEAGTVLLQTYNESNHLEFRNPADYSLIRSLPLPDSKLVLCNQDPVTGWLLLTDYKYLYIIDYNTGIIKLKMKSNDMRPRLYNNFIYGHSGYTFNILPFIN